MSDRMDPSFPTEAKAGSKSEKAGAESGSKAECEQALEQVYAFLDHELDPDSAQAIREHLAACEPCEDAFGLEVMVKSLIRRSCGAEHAPDELRSRIIVSLTTVRREA